MTPDGSVLFYIIDGAVVSIIFYILFTFYRVIHTSIDSLRRRRDDNKPKEEIKPYVDRYYK